MECVSWNPANGPYTDRLLAFLTDYLGSSQWQVPSALGVVATFALNIEFKAIQRDVRDGMYNPISYIIAHSVLQSVMMLLLTLMAVTVSAYGIENCKHIAQTHAGHVTTHLSSHSCAVDSGNFAPFVLAFAVYMLSFECLAQQLSLVNNPLLGMLTYLNAWFTAFLFAGTFPPAPPQAPAQAPAPTPALPLLPSSHDLHPHLQPHSRRPPCRHLV